MREYAEDIRPSGAQSGDHKLENLYVDCFSHHVIEFCTLGNKITLLSPTDPKRIVAADNISSVFLEHHYHPPAIFASDGIECKLSEAIPTSFPNFVELIRANPITSKDFNRLEIGSNRVSYLLGAQGEGKSILISKLIRHCSIERVEDASGYTCIPIYYDFESRAKDDKQLRDIDGRFFTELLQIVYSRISSDHAIARKADLTLVEMPSVTETGPSLHIIHYLRCLIRYLAERRIRLLFIFDNLDRYHFFYTKYSFFKPYNDNQAESVLKNVCRLIQTFSTSSDLGLSGLCVLIVCRRNVFEYLSLYDGVIPREETSSVFEIGNLAGSDVVSPRIDLFAAALDIVKPIFHTLAEDKMEDLLSHLRGFMAVKEVARGFRESPDKRVVFEALRSLGHHGHRSVVRFLALLKLRYKDSDVIERLLSTQPSLLLLLYICNRKKRFSQSGGHFPNLFLNDCTVSPSSVFADAHQPHVHTYWLKYFILKYVSRNPNCTGQDIFNLLCRIGQYEDHLVLLALGSLCTTDDSRCIEIDYARSLPDPLARGLSATQRGAFLVAPVGDLFGPIETDVEFCFSFTYLQLVSEDHWLALPKPWFSQVFTNTNYSYLYAKAQNYGHETGKVLSRKERSVFHFVRVLKASLNAERTLRPRLFAELAKLGVLPDMAAVAKSTRQTIRTLQYATNRQKDYREFEKLWEKIDEDDSLDKHFSKYYEFKPLVDPNA